VRETLNCLASPPFATKRRRVRTARQGRVLLQSPVRSSPSCSRSPNVFFSDVASEQEAFYDKALEGFMMFALDQGEVCTCPSQALIQSSMYDQYE
jgi:hypothetical protein